MNEDSKVRHRRKYDDKFKQQVVAECDQPGASIASIALSHGINANLVHTWRRESRQASAPPEPPATPQNPPTFIPLALAPNPVSVAADICIELRRGGTTVAVTWPLGAAAECATWLREILR